MPATQTHPAAGSPLPLLYPLSGAAPTVEPLALDQLWFQVAGTVCNLRCAHCFISCAPENHAFWFMSLSDVQRHARDALALGVREFYLTGGEPFMNREITEIVAFLLEHGPVTVLTNATLLRERDVARLAAAERASPYSLELRVSIDGPDAAANDPVRGAGTFERAMQGIELLLHHRLLPIVTAVQVWAPDADEDVRCRFIEALRARGYANPRIKLLPRLAIGREVARTGGYHDGDRVTHEMMQGFDVTELICSSARVATSRGIWVCPILLDAPDARLGDTLHDALVPYPLRHHACYTCWLYGAICSNYGVFGER
ncbi:MAG: radical SAM protein [Longimicrobiales bacterium]